MNKVKTIKVKNEDGSISEESYTIAADALNIDMANGKNVQETIGTIDVDNDGNVAAQLNKKINKSDIIDNLDSSDNNKVLSAKQGKVLNEAIAAANSDIKKKIYYFNTVADMKVADLQVGDTCQTLGYYEENDGDSGLYKIIDDSQLIDDDGSVIGLENGLKAQLIKDNKLDINIFRNKLYMSKIGRLNFTDYIKNGYYGMQAGCYVGNNQYIFPLIKNDSLGTARIFKIDFTTGMIIDYRDTTGIFHANGCCLKGDKLYFVQSFDNNDQDKNGIVEVDITTLEVTNTFTINFNNETQYRIFAIGYDTKYNKFYLISYDYFYIADESFNVENIIQFQHPISRSLIRQGGTFYEDYVCYVSNNENAIVCFNRDGSLHHIIDIGQQQFNNFFGEIENINVYNGILYCNANLHHNTEVNLTLLQFFKASLVGGGLPQAMSNNVSFNNNDSVTIIVDKTSYNNLSDFEKFTCNGTNKRPIETIAEALTYIDNKRHYIIAVNDTNEYLQSLAIYNKNLTIKANNSTTGSIKILGSKVNLSNIRIDKASYRTPAFGSATDYISPLYITCCSEVWITGTSGFNYEKCIAEGMIYPCIVEGSTFYDGSSNFGDYHKFIKSFNNTIYPLIIASNVISSTLNNIKNNKVNFSSYKDNTKTYTGIQTLNLKDIPLYTNSIRGFSMALEIRGIGNTDYHKYTSANTSRFIVRDSTSGKWGFTTEFNANNNTITIKPKKWNYSTNSWDEDTETKYVPFYEFDV